MYEILGWYTVGTEATELDLRIQRQVRLWWIKIRSLE